MTRSYDPRLPIPGKREGGVPARYAFLLARAFTDRSPMTPPDSFEKRQRDQRKQQKRKEKLERKLQRKNEQRNA